MQLSGSRSTSKSEKKRHKESKVTESDHKKRNIPWKLRSKKSTSSTCSADVASSPDKQKALREQVDIQPMNTKGNDEEEGVGIRMRKKAVASFPNVLQTNRQEDKLDGSLNSKSLANAEKQAEISRLLELLCETSNCGIDGRINERPSGLTLLYLTPVSESGGSSGSAISSSSSNPNSRAVPNEKDCLTYCYPRLGSSHSLHSSDAVIAKLKGMFLTLSHVVNGITDQKPIKSFIQIKRKRTQSDRHEATAGSSGREGKEKVRFSDSHPPSGDVSQDEGQKDNTDAYHIAYVHEYSSILMVALSEYWNDNLIRASDLVSSVARMIRFRFDSLDAGFKNPHHHACITHFLNIMMSTLVNGEAVHHLSSMSLFSAQRLIMDDDELNLTISEVLTEYEAKDWLSHHIVVNSSSAIDSVTMFVGGSCGDFIVAGTALFQKGFLIQSHLSPGSLSDIITYLNFRGILRLSATASCKLVHWIEVHPNRGTKGEENEGNFTSDFPENEGSRFFLLVVCIKYTLLSVLLEVPFLSVDSKVMPNETIILQSIRFIVSRLQRCGLVDQINDHIALQSKCQVVRIQQLNEIASQGMGSHSSSAMGSFLMFQHSKGKLRNRIKSLSLRNLLPNASSTLSPSSSSQSQQQLMTHLSSSPTGHQQRRSLILSVPRSPDDLNSKSCSSPSLASGMLSPSKRRSSAGLRLSNITSNESTISSLSEIPIDSLIESEISVASQNTTTTTASVSDSQYSSCSLSFRYYFEQQRRRLPDNLVLFIDQDSKSGSYFAPVTLITDSRISGDRIPSSGKLSEHFVRQQVMPEFRSCCLHLRTFIQSHYPVVREYGMHFSLKPTTRRHSDAADKRDKSALLEEKRKISSGLPSAPKERKKSHQSEKEMTSFWAAVRKESHHREVYACFIVAISDKDNKRSSSSGNLAQLSSGGLNVSMESLSYALSLQNREI